MRYPRIIAHRCGGALAPENTLAGLEIAARLGCGGVEFDAVLAADGLPVLMHDETLERTTGCPQRVTELDSHALRRLDAGARHHPAFAREPVPALGEVLHRCAVLGLWANVEIKPASGQERLTGRAVARAVADSALRERVLLSSFSEEALQQAREAAPDLPRALLVESVPADWQERLAVAGAAAIHFSAREATLDQMAELFHAGIPFACYTVNRREEGDYLLAAGAAAIFTDRPDRWPAAEM